MGIEHMVGLFSISKSTAESLGFVIEGNEISLYRGSAEKVRLPDVVDDVTINSINSFAFAESVAEEIICGSKNIIIINNGILISHRLKKVVIPRCYLPEKTHRSLEKNDVMYNLVCGEIINNTIEKHTLQPDLIDQKTTRQLLEADLATGKVINNEKYFDIEIDLDNMGVGKYVISVDNVVSYLEGKTKYLKLVNESEMKIEHYLKVTNKEKELLVPLNKELINW